jgi:hypothetical protein
MPLQSIVPLQDTGAGTDEKQCGAAIDRQPIVPL